MKAHARHQSALLVILALLIPLLFPTTSSAADFYREGHLIMGGSLGVGQAWLGDEVPDSADHETGFAANFRVGYGLSPSFSVGVEASSWTDFQSASEGDAELSFRTFGPSVAYYPSGGAFYLRGIVGWGTLELTLAPAQSARLKAEESGWGFAAAVGYEWRLSSLVALSPQLDLGYLDVGEVSAFTHVLGDAFEFSAWWINATLSITLYM